MVNAIAAFNGITDLAAAPLSELQATKNSLETAKNIVDDLQLASTTEIASENVTDVDDEIEIKLAIIDAQIDVVDTQETFNNQKQNFLNGVTFQDVGGSSVSLLTDPGIIQGAVDNLFNKALEVAQAQVILNELKNEILNNYPTITQTMVDNLYEAAKQVVSAETVLGGLALEDYWEMIPGRFPGMGAYGQSGFFAEKWTNSSIMIPQIKEYARKKLSNLRLHKRSRCQFCIGP